MPTKMTDTGPAIGEPEIQKLESEVGFELPTDFREFTLKHNGGEIAPSHLDRPEIEEGDPTWTMITFFYRVANAEERQTIAWNWRLSSKSIPSHLLPFAEDLIGANFCISLDGPDRGSVFLHDYDCGGASYKCDYEDCSLLAPSFSNFLEMLRERTADDKDP